MASPISKWVTKMFAHSFKKQWYETYWGIDLHGSAILPNHTKDKQIIEYYPFAKETLQILSARPDIIIFTYTASYPEQLQSYLEQFEKDGIHFNYINENPEISEEKGHFGCFDKKPYFNVLIEDKAGFDPEKDWADLYYLMKYYETINHKPDPNWSRKF
jgi:hypothetical protein